MQEEPEAEPSEIIDVPELTGILGEPFSLRKCWGMMKFFGPAAVIASLSLGVGETIMVTSLGAWAEYRLLWLLLISVIVKAGFVPYLIGRYTAITGEMIGHRLLRIPGPRGWLLILLLSAELCSVSVCFTALAKPCGNLITMLTHSTLSGGLSFHVWENIWTTVLLISALSLSLVTTYKSLERQQIIICGIIMAGTLIAVAIVQPDFGRLALGMISIGTFPEVPAWGPSAAKTHYILNLVTTIGFVGGGLSGYIAYSSWVALSGWGLNSHPQIEQYRQRASREGGVRYLPEVPSQAQRLHVLLSPLRWDVSMGWLVLFLITTAFTASGAVILYPQQIAIGNNAWELLTQQAGIWRQINVSLVPIYYVVIVAALWGTLASVPEAVTRMTYDFLSALIPESGRNFSVGVIRWGLCLWLLAISVVMTWSGVSFTLLTAVAALVASSFGLALVFGYTLYANTSLPPLYRPSKWFVIGGFLAAILLVVCVVGGIWELVSQLVTEKNG